MFTFEHLKSPVGIAWPLFLHALTANQSTANVQINKLSEKA
jgi:hypothetical protein